MVRVGGVRERFTVRCACVPRSQSPNDLDWECVCVRTVLFCRVTGTGELGARKPARDPSVVVGYMLVCLSAFGLPSVGLPCWSTASQPASQPASQGASNSALTRAASACT